MNIPASKIETLEIDPRTGQMALTILIKFQWSPTHKHCIGSRYLQRN
jgi:hypothetical protein